MARNENDASTGTELELATDPALPMLAEIGCRDLWAGRSADQPDGLLTGLTKQVLETALQVEMAEHLGYEGGDSLGQPAATPATARHRKRCGRPTSANSIVWAAFYADRRLASLATTAWVQAAIAPKSACCPPGHYHTSPRGPHGRVLRGTVARTVNDALTAQNAPYTPGAASFNALYTGLVGVQGGGIGLGADLNVTIVTRQRP